VVENLNYLRDNIGNITSITNSVNGKVTAYTYNARYQLSNVNSTVNSEDRSYTYDAVGNRKTMLENAITYYYNHSTGNRLSDVRTGLATGPLYRQFTYDDAGRITAKSDGNGVIIYLLSYTDKGQVFASYTPLAGAKSYAYDANDYRINKNNTLYHLEGENLEATYDSTGVLQDKYLRGVIVDEIVNGFTYHSSDQNDWTNYTFHHDHLNSVTAQTGHNGTTEETTNYDAFGSPSLTLPGTGNDLLYTGREYDQETKLYYYRARYYDAEIGRFISEDPLGFQAGINFYAYVNNNPVNFNDPMGKDDFIFTPGNSTPRVEVTGSGRFSPPNFFLNINGTSIPSSLQAAQSTSNGFSGNIQSSGVSNNFVNTSANTMINQSLLGANSPGSISMFRAGVGGVSELLLGIAIDPEISQFTRESLSGGAFDFKQNLNSENLFMFGGQLETPDFLGNVAFAAGANQLGFGEASIRIGSQAQAITQTGSFDLPGDQRALGAGFDFNFTTPSASGGFVLYPSKPNTNMLQSVYRK